MVFCCMEASDCIVAPPFPIVTAIGLRMLPLQRLGNPLRKHNAAETLYHFDLQRGSRSPLSEIAFFVRLMDHIVNDAHDLPNAVWTNVFVNAFAVFIQCIVGGLQIIFAAA